MTLAVAENYPASCGLATSTFARTFPKRAIADRKFDVTASEVRRVIAAAGESVVSLDKNGNTGGTSLKNVLRKSGATYVTDYKVAATVRGDGYFQPIALSSDATGVLSHPTSSGVATFQSNGPCTLRATSADGEVALVSVTASTTSPATVDTFQSWVAGSLARHCTDQIDGLIASKSQLNLYTNYQFYGPNDFARNANCWANGIDLSCASPWNSTGGATRAGTLVSPMHVVFCQHAGFYPANGATITFVSQSGAVVTKTMASSVHVGGAADIRVGVLDSDVGGGVTFAKVLPTTWANHLPGINSLSTIPAMCLNQTERASIAALRSLNMNFENAYPAGYAAYYGEIVLFDSGNPTFLVVAGQPVLLGVFRTGGAGGGSFISYYTTEVNAAMTSLGGGYQLTPVDLSGFTNYA